MEQGLWEMAEVQEAAVWATERLVASWFSLEDGEIKPLAINCFVQGMGVGPYGAN